MNVGGNQRPSTKLLSIYEVILLADLVDIMT